jgi:hypothetical protein
MIARMLNRTELVIKDSQNQTRAIIADVLASNTLGSLGDTKYGNAIAIAYDEEARVTAVVKSSILDKLHFQTMTHRHEEVVLKHKRTFEWIFHSTSPKQLPWTNFAEWLRDGSGTYWINGKAGSGKSTLMRFIYDSARTQQELFTWAETIPLTTAGFFFWNSGNIEQRSTVGLLRTLLHEVLSKHQDLIPLVLPWYWAQGYSEASKADRIGDVVLRQHVFNEERLLQAFFTLITQEIIPLKLCLFIDGLDEFEGDHGRMAELFKDISTSPYVKVCVSSRPLLALEDAFSSSPGLRLQDLTFDDIEQYVNVELRSNRHYLRLAQDEPQEAPALTQEIVLKAEGVFLWVTLVVNSLLSGLGNRDSIEDLQHRLRLLPSELEALYELMLFKRVDGFYKEKSSRIFQIVRAGREQKDDITSDGDTLEPLSVLSLSFADESPETAINMPIEKLDRHAIIKRCKYMEDRLKVRCAGLLEVKVVEDDASEKDMSKSQKSPFARVMGKVQYLHRTVRDYLEQEEVWKTLLSYTVNSNFHPHRSLLISHILSLKIGEPPRFLEHLLYTASIAMICAYQADLDTGQPSIALVDSLDRSVSFWYEQLKGPSPPKNFNRHWSSMLAQWNNGSGFNQSQQMFWQDTFLSLAVQYGLKAYVHEKVKRDPHIIAEKEGRPLLHYAIDPGPTFQSHPITPEMVGRLVWYGADPNECFEELSTWRIIRDDVEDLATLGYRFSDVERTKLLKWLEIVISLVNQGNLPVYTKTTDEQSSYEENWNLSLIIRLFESRLPVEINRLKEVIDRATHGGTRTQDIQVHAVEEYIIDYSKRDRSPYTQLPSQAARVQRNQQSNQHARQHYSQPAVRLASKYHQSPQYTNDQGRAHIAQSRQETGQLAIRQESPQYSLQPTSSRASRQVSSHTSQESRHSSTGQSNQRISQHSGSSVDRIESRRSTSRMSEHSNQHSTSSIDRQAIQNHTQISAPSNLQSINCSNPPTIQQSNQALSPPLTHHPQISENLSYYSSSPVSFQSSQRHIPQHRDYQSKTLDPNPTKVVSHRASYRASHQSGKKSVSIMSKFKGWSRKG